MTSVFWVVRPNDNQCMHEMSETIGDVMVKFIAVKSVLLVLNSNPELVVLAAWLGIDPGIGLYAHHNFQFIKICKR